MEPTAMRTAAPFSKVDSKLQNSLPQIQPLLTAFVKFVTVVFAILKMQVTKGI